MALKLEGRLATWAEQIDRLRWAAFLMDNEFRVAWVSDEWKEFAGEHDEEKLGYGRHMLHAFQLEAWRGRLTEESQTRIFMEVAPFLIGRVEDRIWDELDEPFATLVSQLEPVDMPFLWTTWFDYHDDKDLPPYRVNMLGVRLHDESGERLGTCVITFMDVRPNLLALLARGDEAMYERMARLTEPGRRRAAILFADVEGAGQISRQLASGAYFALIRELTTCMDSIVAEHDGVIGKHGGDGVTAYFLADDLGTPSRAVAAAISAARAIHERSHDIFSTIAPPVDGDGSPCKLRIGLHWGSGLFMGQLVPGGRLDLAALGDEVNECARIQEAAHGHTTLASKPLLERLDPDDAHALGIDVDRVLYRPLSEMPGAPERSVTEAGAVPVTEV